MIAPPMGVIFIQPVCAADDEDGQVRRITLNKSAPFACEIASALEKLLAIKELTIKAGAM
jgi:hypothetical protein